MARISSIQCWRSKFQSKVQKYMWDRRISQRSSVNLIGQCHGYRHVTYDKYTISPGCRGSMAKSRPATAAGLRAAVEGRDAAKLPRLPGEIVFIIMEPILDSNRETSKNRTRRESFLAKKKNDRNFQPCEIANISPSRRFAISHGSNRLIQCWRSKFRSKVQGYMWDRRLLLWWSLNSVVRKYPVTRFLKVPELPDSKYSDSIVDHFGFATSLISTEPVQVATARESWYFTVFENSSRHWFYNRSNLTYLTDCVFALR